MSSPTILVSSEMQIDTYVSRAWIRRYHGKIWSPLPKNGRVKEIAKRCLIVALAPLVFVALLFALVIELIGTNIYLNWEIDKFRKSGILTSKLDAGLDACKREFDQDLRKLNYLPPIGNSSQVKLLFCRALELKKQLQKDHYVFLHGQNAQWSVVSCFIGELINHFQPSDYCADFAYLRTSKHTAECDIIGYRADLLTSQNQKNDHDPEIRKSLLSADCCFLHGAYGESALSFLTLNGSVLSSNDPQALAKVCKKIIEDYDPKIDIKKMDECCQELHELSKRIHVTCGNLFVIAVPKLVADNGLDNIGYLSHPYGVPCCCHPGKEQGILDQLQDENVGSKTSCSDGTTPQFRLLTSALNPGIGVQSHLLTSFSAHQKKTIIRKVQQIVARLLNKNPTPGVLAWFKLG